MENDFSSFPCWIHSLNLIIINAAVFFTNSMKWWGDKLLCIARLYSKFIYLILFSHLSENIYNRKHILFTHIHTYIHKGIHIYIYIMLGLFKFFFFSKKYYFGSVWRFPFSVYWMPIFHFKLYLCQEVFIYAIDFLSILRYKRKKLNYREGILAAAQNVVPGVDYKTTGDVFQNFS